MNLENITKEVCLLTKEVGTYILSEKGKLTKGTIEVKGLNDFVTHVDKTAEKLLVDGLAKLIPESGFVAEENTSSKKGTHYNWIIDPLDGTTNFIHSLPCFCISIALMRDTKLVAGVVHELNFDECFYAWENSAAYMNDTIISVTKTANLKDALLATGFPYYDYSRLNEYMELFKYFMKHTHGIRRLGSAAADLAYVACGRLDGFYEYCLKPWDVAAGAFIVQQAGGKVSDFSGGENYLYGQEIVCGNTAVFDELLNAVKTHMT
ncbi:MAG TPA: inositol monophosphatase family protein [Bacteroidia bacterium]|nr:inositol monophosphatase family protein [Bacteroidia bacterium]